MVPQTQYKVTHWVVLSSSFLSWLLHFFLVLEWQFFLSSCWKSTLQSTYLYPFPYILLLYSVTTSHNFQLTSCHCHHLLRHTASVPAQPSSPLTWKAECREGEISTPAGPKALHPPPSTISYPTTSLLGGWLQVNRIHLLKTILFTRSKTCNSFLCLLSETWTFFQ